ncbi:hypothetical protein [Streptomyces sp. NPDC015125]|uniref:hypothetical protein n=1 Tax=Streptomyces sp. NPDC015125 TaxID=3364938 RepID=UPI0036F6FBC3
MTDELRQRIADAIRPTMLMGLQDAELFDAPGAERIGEWVDWISNKVTEVLQSDLDQLRGRIHSLHKYVPDADYCDLCSNHGDITWPCATVRALDGPPEPAPAVHVGGNAEDCPACDGTNPPYLFICPGPDSEEA